MARTTCVGMLLSIVVAALPMQEARANPPSAPASAAQITALNDRAVNLYQTGHPREALPLAEEALRLREALRGPNHPEVATNLNNLASILVSLGEFERAAPLHERALRIREAALGPNHLDVAESLNNLGGVRRRMGQYERARDLHERALHIRELALGPNHPTVAQSLNNLAMVLDSMGQYERSLALHERALRIRERALGPRHPDLATSLCNVAGLLSMLGRYERVVPLYERALHIDEAARGPNHPEVATDLNNLAHAFADLGRYERAIPLYERAIRIRESTLGPIHLELASSLNNLAEVYASLHQYERALPVHERALQIRETALGPDHPDVAASLNNLAAAFHATHQDARALPLLERSLRLRENALGHDHPSVATALGNLALVLNALNEPARAMPLLERALHIDEAAFGPNHPSVAVRLNNIAETFVSLDQRARALPLLERALRIDENALGPSHPDLAADLENLANVLVAQGQDERALPLYERALVIHAVGVRDLTRHQSPRSVARFLERLQGASDTLISFAVGRPSDARARTLALQAALLFKACGEEVSVSILAAMRRSASPEDRSRLTQWTDLQQRLAALTDGPPAERTRLETDLRATEEQMARQTSALREQRQLAEVATIVPGVAGRLASDTALVELIAFTPVDARARTPAGRWGAPHYAAFVLRADGSNALVDLGERSSLDALAAQLAATVTRPDHTVESVAAAGRALSARLFAPLVPLLSSSVGRLLLAPDGPLHLAPLHLMHDGQRWLADRYTVSYLTSGRDLLRQRSELDVPGEPAALAVTRYAVPAWNLPGLTTQADLLPRLVPGIRVMRDGAATESALRDLAAPRVLHIAAHGQFLAAADDLSGDPMQRGRLVMADASPTLATRDDGNDGLATAAELLTMNLRGTRLVVLSACETAQGSAAVGQGVFGLRRAFLLAGAEARVTTQWDVDELAGAVFTVALYEGLRAGMRSADAVARAVRVVRERDPDPFAWAPFILVGRDDAIDWAAAPVWRSP